MTRTEMLAWGKLFEMYQTNPDRVEELMLGEDNSPVKVWQPYQPKTLDIFDRPLGFYRIRPERKFRAWKPEEVPLGRVVRKKSLQAGGRRELMTQSDKHGVGTSSCILPFSEMLQLWVLEMPDGSTVPCGIEETNGQD